MCNIVCSNNFKLFFILAASVNASKLGWNLRMSSRLACLWGSWISLTWCSISRNGADVLSNMNTTHLSKMKIVQHEPFCHVCWKPATRYSWNTMRNLEYVMEATFSDVLRAVSRSLVAIYQPARYPPEGKHQLTATTLCRRNLPVMWDRLGLKSRRASSPKKTLVYTQATLRHGTWQDRPTRSSTQMLSWSSPPSPCPGCAQDPIRIIPFRSSFSM
jgi:hypothetical protein